MNRYRCKCFPGARAGSAAHRRPACRWYGLVEGCFNRLKQWGGIATRYEKTAESYQAAVTLASLLMWA